MVTIRSARPDDEDAMLRIIRPVISSGETYTLPPEMSDTDALAYWTASDRETFVAAHEGRIVGTYYLRANQQGGGSHVANAGFMTATDARGLGAGRRMCEHAIARARDRGFRAMQFNFVVGTNEGAVRLWTSLGFETVGRLPLAFLHPRHGYTDALVMYRAL